MMISSFISLCLILIFLKMIGSKYRCHGWLRRAPSSLSSSVLHGVEATYTLSDTVQVTLQWLHIKLQLLSLCRMMLDICLQFLGSQQVLFAQVRFRSGWFLSLFIPTTHCLRLRSLRNSTLIPAAFDGGAHSTRSFTLDCIAAGEAHVWVLILLIIKVNYATDLFLAEFSLECGPQTMRFLDVLWSVGVIANLLFQYLPLVLNWSWWESEIMCSMIVPDKLLRHRSQTIRLLVHAWRENGLTYVLGVIIHDHVCRFFNHILKVFALADSHAFHIWEISIDLWSTLCSILWPKVLPQVSVLRTECVEGPV